MKSSLKQLPDGTYLFGNPDVIEPGKPYVWIPMDRIEWFLTQLWQAETLADIERACQPHFDEDWIPTYP